LLWEGLQDAFEGHDEVYNNLQFADDEVFGELHYMYFKKVVRV